MSWAHGGGVSQWTLPGPSGVCSGPVLPSSRVDTLAFWWVCYVLDTFPWVYQGAQIHKVRTGHGLRGREAKGTGWLSLRRQWAVVKGRTWEPACLYSTPALSFLSWVALGKLLNLPELQRLYLQTICLNLDSSESRDWLKNLGAGKHLEVMPGSRSEGVERGWEEGRGRGSEQCPVELAAAVGSEAPSCWRPCKVACRMPSESSLQSQQVEAFVHWFLSPFGWSLSPGDPTSGQLALQCWLSFPIGRLHLPSPEDSLLEGGWRGWAGLGVCMCGPAHPSTADTWDGPGARHWKFQWPYLTGLI